MRELKNRKYRYDIGGFTLIELLVGLAVGMIVLLAVAVSWSIAVRNNAYALTVTALNNDMRSIMHIVTQDIRRASDQFDERASEEETIFINDDGNCIAFDANVYTLDEIQTGSAQPTGYRLTNTGFEIWHEPWHDSEEDLEYVDKSQRCNSGSRWAPVHNNGDRGVDITRFQVDTSDSYCIDLIDILAALDDTQPLPDFEYTRDRCAESGPDRVEVTVVRIMLEGSVDLGGEQRMFSFSDLVRINNNKLFIAFD